MVDISEALKIKHIIQYCYEINSNCDICKFYEDCYSRQQKKQAETVLGEKIIPCGTESEVEQRV